MVSFSFKKTAYKNQTNLSIVCYHMVGPDFQMSSLSCMHNILVYLHYTRSSQDEYPISLYQGYRLSWPSLSGSSVASNSSLSAM